MISLFTLLLGLAAIAVFGRVVAEAFGRAQQRGELRSATDEPRAIDYGAAPERSVTQDIGVTGGTHLPPAQPMAPAVERERRMALLKKQYVEDEITVEQYEAELDKLMREG